MLGDVSRSSQAVSSPLTAAAVRRLSRRCKENHVPGIYKVTLLFYTGLCRSDFSCLKHLGHLLRALDCLTAVPVAAHSWVCTVPGGLE